HGLRLIAAQRKRYGELAAGLDRKLTRRATALAQRGFRFSPWRLGLNGQRLGLRSRLQEVQARHRCGTCGQHEATHHDGNDSAHDWIPPTGRHRAAFPPKSTTIEARPGPAQPRVLIPACYGLPTLKGPQV